MIKTLLTLLLHLSFGSTFAQAGCGSVSGEIVKTYKDYTAAKIEKIRKKKNLDTETLYAIAEFMRHKGDTAAYQNWYINYIDVSAAQLNCNKNKVYKDCLLLRFAKACYYTGNLIQAQACLDKATASKCPDSCVYYYANLIKEANTKTGGQM
jgi:hypothetical protein